MKVVVAIPAFEPTEVLTGVVEGLRNEGFARFVVVDDGSSPAGEDHFAKVAAMPGCTVLRHEVNRGKGMALKTAFRYVLDEVPEAEGIVTVDADGQHAPADCRRLVDALDSTAHGYCLGVREFSLKTTPFRSWWGNRWTSLEFALLYHRWVSDTQTGLRAFRRDLTQFFLDLPGEGYEYEMTCLCAAARAGMDFLFAGISTIYEAGNASSHFNPWRDTMRIHRAMLAALGAFRN